MHPLLGDRFTSRSTRQPLSGILRGKSVEGALLSVGDGRFAQGDDEITGAGLEGSLRGANLRPGLTPRSPAPFREVSAGRLCLRVSDPAA